MGACDSLTSNARKARKGKEKERNAENPLIPDKMCILPKTLAIRDDIKNYYSLSPQYIGHGASGVVYEGQDKNGKRYAIKQINKTAIKDINSVLLEAEISLLLSNEHIVKCYHIFEDTKTISFVLDLIEGGDLFYFITSAPDGKLSEKDALDLIIQILKTIKYLHIDMNITHRDIKPENFLVLIENNIPKVKLIDFGFSCFIPKNHFMNDNLGSPLYLAPEIVENQQYNKNVDIWSAGVILFNMLTGTQPFSSDNNDREEINEKIVYSKICFGQIENVELRELCMGMLERHPEFRLSAENALKMAQKIEINDEGASTQASPLSLDNCKTRVLNALKEMSPDDRMKNILNIVELNCTAVLPDNDMMII